MGRLAIASQELRSAVRPILQRFCTVFAAAVLVAVMVTAAHAEEAEGGAAAGGGKSWAIPWLIVVLAVALGIFITLRPAGRDTEIKRDSRVEL